MHTHVHVAHTGPIATVTMQRPEVHNAFNPALIAELTSVFRTLSADSATRCIVLTGAGASFSAGGDIAWMQESAGYSEAENLADAKALDELFNTINSAPKPVIGRINGAALGGGVGLVACCDLAFAVEGARFGFTEVKLGLIPAVIAQYVMPKIGLSQSRALFVSGERFTAERAFEIGLIHGICTEEDLDATVDTLAQRILSSGPEAIREAKALIQALWELDSAAGKRYAIEAIARVRTSPEGQHGLAAFLNKTAPDWHEKR